MKNKYLWIIIPLFIFFINIDVFASTNTIDRSTLNNNGVNKKWKINGSNIDNVLRTKKVDASEKIYDFSDLLTDEEEKQLKVQIDSFIEKYNMDLVILTDYLEYNSDYENEDYAADFYDYNDFGIDFEKYDGILLFRNTYKDPVYNAMYYDMYTFGNAQLYFDIERYDTILDDIYQDLKGGQYFTGFSSFVSETNEIIGLGKAAKYKDYIVDDNGMLKEVKTFEIPWVFSSIISGIFTFMIIMFLVSKNKMVKTAATAEEYLKKNESKITNRVDTFITSHITSYTEVRVNGGGGSGGGGLGGGFSGGSSFGSSGGGHSSGGGRHG